VNSHLKWTDDFDCQWRLSYASTHLEGTKNLLTAEHVAFVSTDPGLQGIGSGLGFGWRMGDGNGDAAVPSAIGE